MSPGIRTDAHAVAAGGFHLRARLMRKEIFRMWKSAVLAEGKSCIRRIRYEQETPSLRLPADPPPIFSPSIVLPTFSDLRDFLILSYLFGGHNLTLAVPRHLPDERLIHRLSAVNHILYLDDNLEAGYSFFRRLLATLRDYNRAVVFSHEAARRYASGFPFDPATVVRLAMIANVPIVPVVFDWQPVTGLFRGRVRRCDVWVGKKIYVSPRNEEFRDIFFRRRGFRKFSRLSREELDEIAGRIFAKLKPEAVTHGSDLPQEMAAQLP